MDGKVWHVLAKVIRSALIFFAGFAAGIVTTYHVILYECPASVIVYMNPVRWSIRHFVKALADGDAKALTEHVQLPFERRYPSGLRQLYQRRRTVSSDSELLWSS